MDAGAKRKTLDHCFDVACDRLRNGVKGMKKAGALEEFINGSMNISDLRKRCKVITNDGEKFEKAEQLMVTLGRVQSAIDGLLSAAPESVSMVWLGISSLISLGTMTMTVKQRVYSTCNSIATMMKLCLRLEQRSPVYEPNSDDFKNISSPEISIWEFDIPELVFLVLDFLWHARPHDASRSIKVYGRAIKETFTGDLDSRATALLDQYQSLVEKAQVLYEDYLVRENLMARLKSDDIHNDLKEISTIARDLMDVAYNQSLKDELDHHRGKVSSSKPQEIHFRALSSRFDDIAGKRETIQWLLTSESYKEWRSKTDTGTQFICIEAPRGHGKSMAMMRIFRDLHDHVTVDSRPILLDNQALRKNSKVLEAVVNVLNPNFGTEDETSSARSEIQTQEIICQTIRKIASVLPFQLYLMIDALDECQDRKERNLLRWKQVRVIVSARDTIGLKGELKSAEFSVEGEQVESKDIPKAKFIVIGKEQNAHDVREYLKYEVRQVLCRLIDPLKDYFELKVDSIVENVFTKASGDFTRARLIIAHLQEPSKLPLEKKIERLPDSIGDIYMASLEALTPSQQELIVTALKWVVWSVAGVSVVEISDHYREIYSEAGQETISASEERSDLLPFDEGNLGAEVKEIIYHLGEAGRDFFRYDPVTGLVNVDISIREWITNEGRGKKSFMKSSGETGLQRYQNDEGHTVLKITLTSSFMKHGDILSPLFSERDVQMSLTLEIYRGGIAVQTLNNQRFQERYMPWKPHWYNAAGRANLPSAKFDMNYLLNTVQKHSIPTEKIANTADGITIQPLENSNIQSYKLFSICQVYAIPYVKNLRSFRFRKVEAPFLWTLTFYEREKLLYAIIKGGVYPWPLDEIIDLIGDILKSWDPRTRTIWIAKYLSESSHSSNNHANIPEKLVLDLDGTEYKNLRDFMTIDEVGTVNGYLEEYAGAPSTLKDLWEEILLKQNSNPSNSPHMHDGFKRNPLYIGALDPKIIQMLIEHNANVNSDAFEGTGVPIINQILHEMAETRHPGSEEKYGQLRQSFLILLTKGATLTGKFYNLAGALHQAARIQDIGIFRQVCQSNSWDVLDQDEEGNTPMHYLLNERPDISNLEDVREMFLTLTRMKTDASDIVNAQNNASESPLVNAVKNLFNEALDWLVKQNVDIHDDNVNGENCVHHLSKIAVNIKDLITIATSLRELGLDWTKRDKWGYTPLSIALVHSNEPITRFLIRLYEDAGLAPGLEDKILPDYFKKQGESILCYLAPIPYSQDLVDSLQRIFPGYMGKYESRHTYDYKTPLRAAILAGNVELARYILAQGLYVCDFDINGMSEIDDCCSELLRGKSRVTAPLLKEILALLFEFCPSDAITALRSQLFQSENSILLESEKLNIASKIDPLSTNDHGWTISEILSVFKVERENLNINTGILREHSNTHRQKRPSKIGIIRSFDKDIIPDLDDKKDRVLKFSESGLEVSLPTRDSLDDARAALANHPVPFNGKTFFFEVSFKILQDATAAHQQANSFFSVGLSSEFRPYDLENLTAIRIEYTCQGGVKIMSHIPDIMAIVDVTNYEWRSRDEQEPTTQYAFDKVSHTDYVIGCGINPSNRKLFFTRNGVMLPRSFDAPYGLLLPIVSFRYCGKWLDGFKINFGEFPFTFEEANEPGWEWEGGTPAAPDLEFAGESQRPDLFSINRYQETGPHLEKPYKKSGGKKNGWYYMTRYKSKKAFIQIKPEVERVIKKLGGLPRCTPGGYLKMIVHQINADGAGPFWCQISYDGAASWFDANVEVIKGVLGSKKKSVRKQGTLKNYMLKVEIPAGLRCTGSYGGVDNACMLRCKNYAKNGPFGGCVPFPLVDQPSNPTPETDQGREPQNSHV
ncbi:hypothetical protein H072_5243 [Dactylellina haptotyla CBS 200.50]|uniref:B30.2/SPRY domain-containing protein n=1 Tax=Dactylellina haptotyla (strain CBS 200.50) TaxID=1284197 RepID=S8AD29_DACHA|nr:hypothetical protein H072_5243 [Dactylellina haptotyla CBS 200.50]